MQIQFLLFSWQDGKCVHCKYLPLSLYKPLEKFSKALYGTKGGTYSARIFRPVMLYWLFTSKSDECIIPSSPISRYKSITRREPSPFPPVLGPDKNLCNLDTRK